MTAANTAAPRRRSRASRSPLSMSMLIFLAAAELCFPSVQAACGSCLGSLALSGAGLATSGSSGTSGGPHQHVLGKGGRAMPRAESVLGYIASRYVLSRASAFRGGMVRPRRLLLAASDKSSGERDVTSGTNSGDAKTQDQSKSDSNDQSTDDLDDMFSDDNYETPLDRGVDPSYLEKSQTDVATSSAMTSAINLYKYWISPLLPPACRFVPTCSQYGIQAIQEFGPTRGALLTAWRLMRCSPFGGRGYDPPRWPPVSFGYGSY